MGKKCEKCSREYDETWGVCLLCGDKLKRREECRIACALEGKVPGEGVYARRARTTRLFFVMIVIFAGAIALIAYFVGTDVWSFFIERVLGVRRY